MGSEMCIRDRSSSDLRVVWLSLLPQEALLFISKVGICKMTPMAPERPFFVGIGIIGNTKDLLWISQRRASPVPSYGWVEILHCSIDAPRVQSPWAPGWKQSPLWMFVAPGSGISVNVGRTYVARDYEEAANLLSRAFTDDAVQSSCPGNHTFPVHDHAASDGWEWYAPLVPHRGSLRSRLRRKNAAARTLARLAQNSSISVDLLPKIEDRAASVDISQLDSIQILRHNEYFSTEERHEIVMLRYRECARLRRSMVKCGRPPRLFACSSKTLHRVNSCGAWDKVWSEKHLRQNLGLPYRCSVSSCYFRPAVQNGPDATYMCPSSIALQQTR